MEKSIGKFILWFAFLACIWYIFYNLNANKEWDLSVRKDWLENSADLDSLTCDSITQYLQSKEPEWFKNCNTNEGYFKSYLAFARNLPTYKKDMILLRYTCSNEVYGSKYKIDSFPLSNNMDLLYSMSSQNYIRLALKDLEKEESRYKLKPFLLKEKVQLNGAKTLFRYLYETYGAEGMVCGLPYYYSVHEWKKISLEFMNYPPENARHYKANNAYFREKIRTVLEEYQKEASNYFCGAILDFKGSTGQWKQYFFVVNDTNPIDYKVYVFETPPNKDCIVKPRDFY